MQWARWPLLLMGIIKIPPLVKTPLLIVQAHVSLFVFSVGKQLWLYMESWGFRFGFSRKRGKKKVGPGQSEIVLSIWRQKCSAEQRTPPPQNDAHHLELRHLSGLLLSDLFFYFI